MKTTSSQMNLTDFVRQIQTDRDVWKLQYFLPFFTLAFVAVTTTWKGWAIQSKTLSLVLQCKLHSILHTFPSFEVNGVGDNVLQLHEFQLGCLLLPFWQAGPSTDPSRDFRTTIPVLFPKLSSSSLFWLWKPIFSEVHWSEWESLALLTTGFP